MLRVKQRTAKSLYMAVIVGTFAAAACGGGEPDRIQGDGIHTWRDNPQCDADAAQMLAMVNAARATGQVCGGAYYPPVRPLVLSAKLNRAAQMWSADMAAHSTPAGHIDSLGRDQQDRGKAVGYSGGVGENSSAGQSSAANANQRFIESPGHCSNLMRKEYRDFGASCTQVTTGYQTYWVHNFGVPA